MNYFDKIPATDTEGYLIYQPIIINFLPVALSSIGDTFYNPSSFHYILRIVSFSSSRTTSYQALPEDIYIKLYPGVPLRFYLLANDEVSRYRVYYIKDKVIQSSQEWYVQAYRHCDSVKSFEVTLDSTKLITLPSDFFLLETVTPYTKYKVDGHYLYLDGSINEKYTIQYLKGLSLRDIVVEEA